MSRRFSEEEGPCIPHRRKVSAAGGYILGLLALNVALLFSESLSHAGMFLGLGGIWVSHLFGNWLVVRTQFGGILRLIEPLVMVVGVPLLIATYFETFSLIVIVACNLICVSPVVALVLLAIHGFRLKLRLWRLGYAWVTEQQALGLYFAIGPRRFPYLPDYESLAVIPGYCDGDVASIAEIARNLPKKYRLPL